MAEFPGYKTLFGYDVDSNRKVLDFMFSDGPPNDRAVKIFAHIIAAHKMWLDRLERGVEVPMPDLWPDTGADELHGLCEEMNRLWMEYLESDKAKDLSTGVSYINMKGAEVTKPAYDILTTVIIHASYHRGQIANFASDGERQAPFIDYIFYNG